ncbi:hypothetical protein [Cytobacillus sp. IB215316]|uniref:hypothetical protein n=1 Tax=Cytobacillus sp. IB215316 TaxID=3097354 RepID=UPI002A0B4E0B|nr:hypothetical protein [Cytobacillus sp. IB215316]MDX8363022.1 hypothetical protein [Cytobacillus sp. IB215316]
MQKLVNNFKTSGGKHCITNALQQVLKYNNYPITEEMIFGMFGTIFYEMKPLGIEYHGIH